MSYIFFLLIPISIFFLIAAVKTGKSLFKQPVIFDSATDNATFRVFEDGMFEIWVKSENFKLNRLNIVRPLIMEQKSGHKIPLIPSILRAHSNGFSEARMHLFSFQAKAGEYLFQTTESSSLLPIERSIATRLLKNKATVPVTFYIKQKPPLWTFPLFFFSIFASITSLIGGIFLPFVF